MSKRNAVPALDTLETDHQVAVFDFLRLNRRKFPIFDDFYHVPNGGLRNKRVAAQLLAEGVRPGVHDIHLDAARRGFYGFKCELKVLYNDLSPDQSRIRKRLLQENYFAHTAWHYAEMINLILWYLDISPKSVQGYPHRVAVVLPPKGGHDERCGCDFRIKDLI
jgi:hypothetical protein